MKRHGSMNRIYRLVWSTVRNVWIPVAETARGRGKRSSPRLVAAALSLTCAIAQASPSGGQVVAGTGSITQSGATTTITQTTQNLSLTWTSFNIAPQQTVNFVQPSTSAIAVNRILGTNGTQILGYLHANGQVFLINPNGIVFGPSAEVNVGGLVASTLDLEAGTAGDTKSFSGTGTGSVVNQGTLTATQGGYVVLLGNHVSNDGVISAQLGTVALGAGSAMTLTFGDNSRLHLQVDQSTLNSLAENGGLIRADGGQVIMTAGARDTLLASAVNNTGVIEARTVDSHDGTITLLGGMTAGTVEVGGTLDASAPEGGAGGLIDTSAAYVEVAGGARVTTAARDGLYGSWLIDPQDFTVAASGGDITGAALSTDLATTGVTLQSSAGGTAGSGNVNVNDAVAWSANTTLTLTASNNVNVNANITATGNSAGLIINPNTGNGSGASAEAPTGTGTFNLSGASITLLGTTPHLSIAGTTYTVINTLGAPGSVTTTDLQGMNGNLSGNYALGSNIDASATSAWNGGAGFTPIGGQGTPFGGTFDGLGHTISNFTINMPTTNYVGLFGYIGGGSTVQNVGLVGGSVIGSEIVGGLVGESADGTIRNSYVTASVNGAASNAGSLVGINYGGTVSNSYATGSVSGGEQIGGLVGLNIGGGAINGSFATGSVSGTGGSVGGLAGANTGSISNSSAAGSVSSIGNYIGGLVGLNGGPISNSNATGSVSGSTQVGGLVGINSRYIAITNSYATGNVSGTGGHVGGLVGSSYGTISNAYATGSVSGPTDVGGLVGFTYDSTLSNSYSTGAVTGASNTGGLVGYNEFGSTISTSYWNTSANPTRPGIGGGIVTGATGLTTAQMQTATNFSGLVFTATPGAAGNNWVMVDTDGTLNNAGGASGATFPMLSSEYSTTITNAHQLQLIAMALGASYTLAANINAAGTATSTTRGDVWSTPGGFVPIGSNNTNFTGSFDGLGHTISGLTINLPNTNYVGLFGYTAPGSVVQNVGLVGGSVIGDNDVGDLVGYNDQGTINNSYATGSVSGTNTGVGGLAGANFGSITNSHATGSVNGSNYVGGLVGANDPNGTITNSYATGSVNGTGFYIGGLVGFDNDSAVSNSYATGNVSGTTSVGGLVGSNYGSTLSNSYSTGGVTGQLFAGGLVGFNHGTISTSYWNTSTNPTLVLGIGGGTQSGATGLTTAQMQNAANFAGFVFTATPGAAGNNWVMVDTDGTLSNAGGASGATFPMLSSEYSTTITNAHQLQLIAMALGASYTLAANINAAGTDTSTILGDVWSTPGGFVPIGSNNANFSGSFDGLGHTISGLTINLPAAFNVGLFGYTSASSTIQNVGLLGGSVAGGGDTGELVGNLGGALTNSYATGDVTGTGGSQIGGLVGLNSTGTIGNSYAAGTVTGGSNVGGLVGSSYGAISNSHATGDVTGTGNAVGGLVGNNYGAPISNSYASGNIAGVGYVGGLVGQGGGVITNSYATGSVTGSSYDVGGLVGSQYGSISNSHATGNVTGNTNVGGLVGYNNGGSLVTTSFATGAVSGVGNGAGNVGGLVGNNYGGAISLSHATGTVTGSASSSVGGLVGFNYGGATITASYATGVVAGETNVGGLAGSNTGTINNSDATGNVSSTNVTAGGLVGNNPGGTISNSYATGTVTGSSYVGGLVGFGSGTISNSHATGDVTSAGSFVGGLVGIYQSGTISASDATGSVSGGGLDIGGLVGNSAGGSISDSYATGNVTGMSSATGGLVGYNGNGLISDSFASGIVQGGSDTGGLVGKNYGTVDTSYASGSTTGTNNVGGLAGFNHATVANSYANNTVNGSFVVGGLVGYNYGGTISNSNASGSVTSASGRVGGLAGNNYGGNAQISNSYATGNVNGSGYGAGGLVGSNGNTIINSHATGTVVDTGDAVGGLVGHNYGPVSNSYATGNVVGSGYGVGGLIGYNSNSVSNTHATGSVNGGDYGVGGLVGKNLGAGAISNSYAMGNVHGDQFAGGLVGSNYGAISTSYATGNVSGTGNNNNGGLVGDNTSTITNSYATGNVSGGGNLGGLVGSNYGTIVNTYATGSVTGTGSVGGLVGHNGDEIEFSFFNSDIVGIGIGSGANAGAEGLTSAGMMTMSNFSFGGWSISETGGTGSVWRIYEGNTAPLLSSFLTPLTVTALNETHTYTGTPATGGLTDASFSVSGAATSGHIFNINNAYNGATNVGTYAPALYSDQLGYDISYVNADLTITPASLTVTANGASRIYGQANPALSGVVTGFVGSDTLANATTGSETYATAATATSNVGSYAITGSGLTANNGNYTFAFAAANATAFSITPAMLTVSGEVAASRTYDGTTDATLTGGSLIGMVSGDTVTLTQAGHFTSPDAGTGVPVTATDTLVGAGASNYVLSEPTDLAANIAPATLTYTAAAVSFTAGQTPSGLNGTLTGFVAGDTELNATTGSLAWTTTAGASSEPGRYDIDGTGLAATNYVFVDAAANATALTLLAPISPPSGPTAPAGPGAAALLTAQNAVTSIDVNLPSSQTNIQLAMLDLSTGIAVTQSLDVDTDVAAEAADNIVTDTRTLHGAMVPSLRIVRGGVKLPNDRIDFDVR
jgi:filamentous hemagglutinin family protein